MERWGLNTAWIRAVLLPSQAKWTKAWDDYRNPKTRTTLITNRKKAARKSLQANLMVAVGMVKAVPGITADELKVAGIAPAVGRGNRRNRAPTETPAVRVVLAVICWIQIYFGVNARKCSGKPHGVGGAEIYWKLGGDKPLSIEDFTHVEFVTHSPIVLKFEESERGQRVWFCLRWIGTAGEVGPWTDIFFTVVP
jgi:hypothetical protein